MDNKDVKNELNIKKDKKKIVFKIIKIVLIIALYVVAIVVCFKSCRPVSAEGYAGHMNALYIDNQENNYDENYNIILSNYQNVYFDLEPNKSQINYFNKGDANILNNHKLNYQNGDAFEESGWSVSPYYYLTKEVYRCCVFDYIPLDVEVEMIFCVYDNNLNFLDYDYHNYTSNDYSYDLVLNSLSSYENIKYVRFTYRTNYNHITFYDYAYAGPINKYVPYGLIDSEYEYNYTRYNDNLFRHNNNNSISVYCQSLNGENYLFYYEYFNVWNEVNNKYVVNNERNFFTITLSNQLVNKYDYYIVYYFNGSYLTPYFVYNNGYQNNNYTDFNYTRINRENILLNYSYNNSIEVYSFPYLNGHDEYDWLFFGEGYTPYSTIRGAYLSADTAIQEKIYYLIGTTGTYDFEDADYHNEYLFGDLVNSFLNIKLGTFMVGSTEVNLTLGVLVLFVIGLGALFIVIKVMLGG